MQTDEKLTIEDGLIDLLTKYGIHPSFKYQLVERPDSVGDYILLPGWLFLDRDIAQQDVPLLTWRVKRSFVELKSIVETNVIENVRLVRFCVFTSDKWSLESLLYREFDLVEYITGSKIVSVNGVLHSGKAGSVIACLENGTLCSVEVSIQLPNGNPVLERHEIIAQRGAASDQVVDSQVPQDSIYMYTEGGEQRFRDFDLELFDYDVEQIDHIRAAFEVISKPDLIEEWSAQHRHLKNLVKQTIISEKIRQKINITRRAL